MRSPYPILPGRALGALGTRLSQARRARELTQAELARLAGIGVSTLASLEAGDPGVAVGNFVRVLEALGLLGQLDQLLNPQQDPALVEQALRRLPERAR
ncbi:MAG TPA: helix-turn-helix domain-containing protein [Ramlibacter sp.]|nr:helix-turn-helix domain-containing protein [Ramlibacter sp.]